MHAFTYLIEWNPKPFSGVSVNNFRKLDGIYSKGDFCSMGMQGKSFKLTICCVWLDIQFRETVYDL